MAAEVILVVSRVRARDLVRALSRPRQRAFRCPPEEALKRLRERSTRAVVLDGGHDKGSDFGLIARIKARCPGVPVIYLAEGGSERTAVLAFRRGARDYYPKPVNLYDLRRNVTRLVDLQKSAGGRRRPYVWSPVQTGEAMKGAGAGVPATILRAVAYMEDHYGGRISLADLAERAGMSRYHFCRVFRSAMGESPVRHLIGLRIDRAGVLLRTTDLAVSEIASLTGFSELGHFSRTFRRRTGQSPSQYRKAGTGR